MDLKTSVPMKITVNKVTVHINNDEVVVMNNDNKEYVSVNANNGHVALGKVETIAGSRTPAFDIMRAMQENEWLNVRDLVTHTGHDAVAVTEVLHSLMDAGEVERRGVFYRWIGDDTSVEEKVAEFMGQEQHKGKDLSVTHISESLGLRQADVLTSLTNLVNSGRVLRRQKGYRWLGD